MNPYNAIRITNANIWDKYMADAFSLTEPMQDPNKFSLMNTKLNPESQSKFFAVSGYSNAGGAACITACKSLHGDVATKRCDIAHPFNKDKRKACYATVNNKKAACIAKCAEKAGTNEPEAIIETSLEPVVTPKPVITPDTSEKNIDDKTKKILMIAGITAGGIIGISLLAWGIGKIVSK